MKRKFTTANGKTYTIETYRVGTNFGVEARARRGGWSDTTARTYPLGHDDSAASAAEALAEQHSQRA